MTALFVQETLEHRGIYRGAGGARAPPLWHLERAGGAQAPPLWHLERYMESRGCSSSPLWHLERAGCAQAPPL